MQNDALSKQFIEGNCCKLIIHTYNHLKKKRNYIHSTKVLNEMKYNLKLTVEFFPRIKSRGKTLNRSSHATDKT